MKLNFEPNPFHPIDNEMIGAYYITLELFVINPETGEKEVAGYNGECYDISHTIRLLGMQKSWSTTDVYWLSSELIFDNQSLEIEDIFHSGNLKEISVEIDYKDMDGNWWDITICEN